MYTTHLIYIEHKSRINVYTREEITPATLWTMVGLNTHVYVAVTHDYDSSSTALDYSRMIVDYEEAASASSWDEYDSILTSGLVLGYKTHLPAYIEGTVIPTNPIKIWDALATLKTFNLDYGDYIKRVYNIFSYRWLLHDLRISIQDDCESETPNLNRCIPIVNGFVCRPAYDDRSNALYALGGAQLCWFDGGHTTPEVQLLDFTSLGDVVVSNIFSEDKYTLNDVLFTERDSKWLFTFTNYSLDEYTPILILAGIMILPDQYSLVNKNTISVNIDTIPFKKALAMKKLLQDASVSNANVAYEALPYKEYLRGEFTKDLSADCFVAFIHTKRLFITRQSNLDVWRHHNTANDFDKSSYLLINKATGTIRNFHLDMLDDRNELIMQNHEVINLVNDTLSGGSLAFIHADSRRHKFQDINKSGCDGLKILGDINE